MIVRVVKMSFVPEKTAPFLAFLSDFLPQIRKFEGCRHLQLLRDKEKPNTLVTLSKWESEIALENYRNSELFKYVWANTKIHFSEKPDAYSLENVKVMP